MMTYTRIKNTLLAKLITRFPSYGKKFIDEYSPWESEDVPWTPVTKPLADCKLALITTGGVHLKSQTPFDMADKDGDPSFRRISSDIDTKDLMITHDYYDHSDAEKDINIIFPIERLRELVEEGKIGRLTATFYSLMGHIDGPHIPTLITKSAPAIVKDLKAEQVDLTLLVPG
jgi:D-proline reductase (dithiol) PrdB